MAQRQKISQMAPKGANLEATDLLEISEASGSGYITKSITGAELVGDYVPYIGATQDVDLGEFELKAGQLEFDQTPTGTSGVAVMRWNDSDGTVDLGLKGGNVTLQVGQEQVLRVVNKTATNINLLEANYQAVRVTGAQGQRLKVDLAQATNDMLSAETIGLVTETINNNQEGFITTSGLVRGVNTTGSLQGETWADGDIVYLSSTTAGNITNIKPVAPNHLIIIGYVVSAHITQGSIFVKVDNGYELDELHNVLITSASNNQTLVYESSSLLWKNKTIATALGYTPAPTEITISRKAASYVLVLTDSYKLIEMDVSTANTLTIPTNTAQPFLAGTQILITQYGTGQVTITPDTGVTLRSSGGKTKTGAQYAMATLIKRSTNEWYLAGDITT